MKTITLGLGDTTRPSVIPSYSRFSPVGPVGKAAALVDLSGSGLGCYILRFAFRRHLVRGHDLSSPRIDPSERVADFHLLGSVAFDDCVRLQRRLVYEVSSEARQRAVVLLCEHASVISVGRSGSRSHIRRSNAELQRQQLSVRWLNRGGGCILHAPGQLAVYPILPLDAFGWNPGGYLSRLQAGLAAGLAEIGIETQSRGDGFGLWGRTGLLAAVGVSIQHGTSCQGAFINVSPNMAPYGFIDTAAPYREALRRAAEFCETAGDRQTFAAADKLTMSCLLAERRQPARMATVRSALIDQLVRSLECDRHNIHSGHPWLSSLKERPCESFARAC